MRVVGIGLLGLACNGQSGEPCLDVDPACDPLYEPVFEAVFEQTLVSSCGLGATSCHSAEGAHAGLSFDDADLAYELLLEETSEGSLVVEGDASCSPLVAILRSEDASTVMPPGDPLSEAEICAIEQWIDAGAVR